MRRRERASSRRCGGGRELHRSFREVVFRRHRTFWLARLDTVAHAVCQGSWRCQAACCRHRAASQLLAQPLLIDLGTVRITVYQRSKPLVARRLAAERSARSVIWPGSFRRSGAPTGIANAITAARNDREMAAMVLATRSAAFVDRPRYQLNRSLALAAAISVNMAALLLLSLVGNVTNLALPSEAKPVDLIVDWIVPRPITPVPEVPAMPRAPEHRTAAVSPPVAQVTKAVPVDPPVVVVETGTEIAAAAAVGQPSIELPGAAAVDRDAYLAYGVAPPPRYPPDALQRGMQGTVVLAVLVGPDGSVQEVRVRSSSGHRLLDQHALRHVRARWSFQPAWRAGRPVAAWALVPVEFRTDG